MNLNNIHLFLKHTASRKQFSVSYLSMMLIGLMSLGILGVGVLPSSAAEETLNNASIIKLQGLDLGDAVIIEKIKASKCDFDTSIDGGLQQLKAAKVSNAVIAAMIAAKTPAIDAVAPPPADLNDPAAPHSAGVWVLQETSGQKKMVQLESEPSVETSSGGYIGPYGIGKVAQTVRLTGIKADLQLSESRPVFYFYLGRAQQGDGAHEFASARSAKDFMLAKFIVRNDAKNSFRGLEVSRSGGYGGSSGIDPKDIREFVSEKVSDGVYKIVPKADLSNGEYSFCRAVTRGQGEFFPFGVRAANTGNIVSDPEVVRLCELLKSDKPSEVEQALKALRKMDAPEAVPKILPCLTSSNTGNVRDACRTLAVLGNKDIIPSIEPLLKHSKADVRKDAQDAIDQLKARKE